jgi:hypothetical protein
MIQQLLTELQKAITRPSPKCVWKESHDSMGVGLVKTIMKQAGIRGPIEIGVANFSAELFKIDEKSNRNWMSAVASNARVVMAGGA